ncbi:MAG: DUF2341 domain-containing protein, partial [Methanomicrobiales archaeon]|nr:DUF2341 domain-containing protein [Methanomicrobiales archaeon]
MDSRWIIGVLLVALLIAPAAGEFSWRQAISVENSSTIDDLPALFNATHLAGMRPDFADIRFVDGGGTAIPHWIENATDGSHAHVWLALPADTRDLFMLYGNPDARGAGDPDAVFTFFEDYERGNLSRWSFCGSNVEVQSSVVCAGAYAGDINVSEPDLRHLADNRISLAKISEGPIAIEGDYRVSEFGRWCGSGSWAEEPPDLSRGMNRSSTESNTLSPRTGILYAGRAPTKRV